MKIFITFAITYAFLALVTTEVDSVKMMVAQEDRPHLDEAKKIEPIKIPATGCIVNVEGERHLLEQQLESCLKKRQWLKISSETGGVSFSSW
jgi:hypothetical protein